MKGNAKFRKILGTFCFIISAACVTGCGNPGSKEYKQAVSYMEEGSYNEAAELMKQAVSLDQGNKKYAVGYGNALTMMADYDNAREVFLGAVKNSGGKESKKVNKQAYRGIAMTYYESGIYDQAKAYFKLALDANVLSDMDNDLSAYYANCELMMNDYEGAAKSFSKLIDKNDKTKATVKAKYYIGRGNAYLMMENFATALEDYDNAISEDNDCYEAYLGRYFALMGTHDKDAADKTLDTALGIKDRGKDSDYYKAVFYFYKSEYEKSLELLQKSLDDGNKEAIYYIGRVYQAQNNINAAIDNYSTYLTAYPGRKNAEICNQMAGCYMAQEDYETAAVWLDDGIKVSGGSMKENLMYNRIIVYERLGDYKSAKELADQYLENYKNADITREYEFIKTRYREEKK